MIKQEKKENLKSLLILLLIAVIFAVIYLAWSLMTYEISGTNALMNTAQYSFESQPTPEFRKFVVSDWKTYENKDYNFSFQYPAEWVKKDFSIVQSGPVFTVKFSDPQRDKEIKISMCLMNQDVDWVNATPTKESCESLLKDLSKTEIKNLNKLIGDKNIFVRVYKNDQKIDLADWLVKQYKNDGELSDYKVGAKILMGGKNGYVSSIGCCGGSDFSYVVQKGDYVYELGTNDSDYNDFKEAIESKMRPEPIKNTFLDQAKIYFKFLDSSGLENWKTFENSKKEYSIKYPVDWNVYDSGSGYSSARVSIQAEKIPADSEINNSDGLEIRVSKYPDEVTSSEKIEMTNAKEKAEIDGNKGVKITDQDGNLIIEDYYIVKAGTLYHLSLNISSQVNKEILDNMVKSFKLAN